MREESLIRRVKNLTDMYSFQEPFSIYLKVYFRRHPVMGARDRRETREWSFNFWRIGKNLEELPFERRLAVACFLCSNLTTPSVAYLLNHYSGLNEIQIHESLERKIEIVKEKYPSFSLDNIFQMKDHLSNSIVKDEWYPSFLKKPKVWIRMRRSFRNQVVNELKEKNIQFQEDENFLTLSFPSEVALEKTKSWQMGYFEIQDNSSQRIREFLNSGTGESWWDACAGSGGKSLLLHEINPSAKLFATDNRGNILQNYTNRLKKSGINNFETMVTDLSVPGSVVPDKKFEGIISDVPCSGSGTWARTPEWLQKNISSEIASHFVPLQRAIVSNILSSLKAGFPLIYITCSVFKEENEENVRYFLDHLPLRLEKSAYLDGYASGSDTLFVVRFSKLF